MNDPDLASACRAFGAFLSHVEATRHHVLYHEIDADGIPAGIVLATALERSGRTRMTRLSTQNALTLLIC